MSEETVRSPDGTRIAFERLGAGPPLLLVHGATVDRTRWGALAPLLATECTVVSMDRRGRGGSGDARRYAVEREVEDVLAVLDALGAPVHLVGHSSGALLALQAAPRARGLGRLVLYEPPFVERPATLAPRLRALLAAGDRAGVVRTFLREGPRRPVPDEGSPEWARLLALAHTMPYDMEIQSEYGLVPARLRAIRVPTLFLLGGASSPEMRRGTEALAAAVPDAQLVELPGQAHTAHVTAPALLAREILRFLTEPFQADSPGQHQAP